MAKRGPKLTPIDWEQFDKLCSIQCSQREIAHWFECSVDTIERAVEREKGMKFAEYFEQKRGRGKIALRRKQYEKALGGDNTMLLWLGKQYLEQADKQDIKSDITQKLLVETLTDEQLDNKIKQLEHAKP